MTFVSNKQLWIAAHMRENSLFHLAPGQRVDLVLDVAPGRIYEATVRSVGVGVSTSSSNNRGELPVVESSQGWLRDPQRFPVIIDLEDEEAIALQRVGGQATVIIYTGERPVLNRLARFRIWLESWLSYVR
jgi:multidrug resistance efflux pump